MNQSEIEAIKHVIGNVHSMPLADLVREYRQREPYPFEIQTPQWAPFFGAVVSRLVQEVDRFAQAVLGDGPVDLGPVPDSMRHDIMTAARLARDLSLSKLADELRRRTPVDDGGTWSLFFLQVAAVGRVLATVDAMSKQVNAPKNPNTHKHAAVSGGDDEVKPGEFSGKIDATRFGLPVWAAPSRCVFVPSGWVAAIVHVERANPNMILGGKPAPQPARAWCQWHEDGRLKEGIFPLSELRPTGG
jgi:hypothetical protein